MFVHVSPASVDLKTPVPAYELRAISTSPVPTQTMLGSEGATAISPMVKVDSFSKMGVQVVPLFTDFQTLPAPAPA